MSSSSSKKSRKSYDREYKRRIVQKSSEARSQRTPRPIANARVEAIADHEGESKPGQYSDTDYLNHFESIVADDAAVIPIYPTGAYWRVSPDLNIDGMLSPVMVVPRFDKLRFR